MMDWYVHLIYLMNIKAEQFENIKRWFQDDNILDNCTISFKENNYDLNKFSKLYNIDFSSELMISIYFEVLVNKNQELFMKQNTSDIISMLKYFTKEKYCEFTDNYLTKFNPSSILDIGCGFGLFGLAAKTLNKKIEYTGVDKSEFIEKNWNHKEFCMIHRIVVTSKYSTNKVCKEVSCKPYSH